ncbi:MAG: DNA replication complex subunit Gins51 [Candidatus Nitrosocosmicus sp.]
MDSNNQNDFISIDEIFNILKREIQLTGGPQSISPNFYQNIANLISTLKHRSIEEVEEEEENKKEKISTQIKSNLLDLYIKSTALLFIYRCKKIFNINKKSNETFDYSNLTDEEKYVFYGNIERENRINIVLNTLFEGKPKTLEKIVSSINENNLILRFLDSMEQFVGVNMNKYGPFKKDDIAILPFENARSIIESDKGYEVGMVN